MKKTHSHSMVADPPAGTEEKLRVILVDDHPVTRQGVAALINQQSNLFVCGEAATTTAAIDLFRKVSPHLAIVDISLGEPDLSGIDLVKKLKALAPDLPVLVMSMHDESVYAEKALKAGARGYVMKQEASEMILEAIQHVLGGEIFLSDRMKDKMVHHALRDKSQEIGFSIDTLSQREMEVFQLIGEGFGTRQIAAKLGLSVKTIDSYREHLKLKLQLKSSADLVCYAIQWQKSEAVT